MTPGWWLYLLQCRDGRTYAGIATDVAARFAVHSRGKGALVGSDSALPRRTVGRGAQRRTRIHIRAIVPGQPLSHPELTSMASWVRVFPSPMAVGGSEAHKQRSSGSLPRALAQQFEYQAEP
jgi:hypothetical protein